MKNFYFLILFISSLQIHAQDNRIILHGIIFSDSLTIDNVNIVNKSTYKGTVSNKAGKFQILVKENDVLQFSNIQYNLKKLKINSNHVNSKTLLVSLTLKINELQEVVVHNMAKSLGLPNADKIPLTQTERKLNYINKGGTIDKLYGWVSGDTKSFKTLQKHLNEDEKLLNNKVNTQIIRNHFTDQFLTNNLKIPKENIDGLIQYCIPKGIVFVFEKERYLEVIDLLIQNKETYLSNLK